MRGRKEKGLLNPSAGLWILEGSALDRRRVSTEMKTIQKLTPKLYGPRRGAQKREGSWDRALIKELEPSSRSESSARKTTGRYSRTFPKEAGSPRGHSFSNAIGGMELTKRGGRKARE